MTHPFIQQQDQEPIMCQTLCWVEEAMVPALEELAVWYRRKPQHRPLLTSVIVMKSVSHDSQAYREGINQLGKQEGYIKTSVLPDGP